MNHEPTNAVERSSYGSQMRRKTKPNSNPYSDQNIKRFMHLGPRSGSGFGKVFVEDDGKKSVMDVLAREYMVSNASDFADVHAALYQSEWDNEEKVKSQRDRMQSFKGEIPKEALNAMDTAVTIFGKDKHMEPEALKWALKNVGAIETGFKTRKQDKYITGDGLGVARGYAQVEPSTAKDLAKNSSPLFGKKFKAKFGKDTLEKIANGTKEEISKMLENDEELAMTMAAAKLMTSNDARRSIVRLYKEQS